MEVTLLSQPLLREVVGFCETAAFAILSAFEDRAERNQAGGEGNRKKDEEEAVEGSESWLLTPADMTTRQRCLLCSLPEHLIGPWSAWLSVCLIRLCFVSSSFSCEIFPAFNPSFCQCFPNFHLLLSSHGRTGYLRIYFFSLQRTSPVVWSFFFALPAFLSPSFK